MQKASDALLGCVLLIAGAIAILDSRDAVLQRLGRLDAEFFPLVLGAATVAVGLSLLGRGALLQRPAPLPWKPWQLALLIAAIAAIEGTIWSQPGWLLYFGPSEYSALLILLFVAAIALARWSRLRALGMALLGLLLGAVGMDVVTGTLRLTMGFEQLTDGISAIFVLLGTIIIADGLICIVSPTLWLRTFAWVWAPRRQPTPGFAALIAMRAVAAIAITAACFFAYALNAQVWDIGLVVVLGLFGVACKLFAWNRTVLILACIYGNVFEQAFRQSWLLSNGDPAVFYRRPITATMLAASVAIIVFVTFLMAKRRNAHHRVVTILFCWLMSAGATVLTTTSAEANPLQPPSVEYSAEILIARGPQLEIPMRIFYAGRKVRTDIIGTTTLYDLDRQQLTGVMPSIRKYDEPIRFSAPIADGRRWVGVEATAAEALGNEEVLGRPTTKYKVRGFVLATHAPFEGIVWSTAENIVLRAEGIAQLSGASIAVKLTVTNLTVGPVNPSLFIIPANFNKSGY